MNKQAKLFYILERHNPQLGVYYVPLGQLSQREAKRREGSLYGMNIVLPFVTQESYEVCLRELEERGELVR